MARRIEALRVENVRKGNLQENLRIEVERWRWVPPPLLLAEFKLG
jgi:hypothetical protein